MAGRALTPATRRSLGRPLPYQQADGPRAHPSAGLAEASPLLPQEPQPSWSYVVLAGLSACYPTPRGRLPTCYSPVRRFTRRPKATFSHDLHVLGAPPAFVLSQDQTLHLIFEKPFGVLFIKFAGRPQVLSSVGLLPGFQRTNLLTKAFLSP